MDLSGRFAFQHVSPLISKGSHEQTIGRLGGFWFFQATPVESTPSPEATVGGGGGFKMPEELQSNGAVLNLMQILLMSGILDDE